MSLQTKIIAKTLHFKEAAGTSRGIYWERKVYYILLIQEDKFGIGEVAPLPQLSIDALPDLHLKIREACSALEEDHLDLDKLRSYPSICFGIETGLKDLYGSEGLLWDNKFSQGKAGIPINGLIWMGAYNEMYERLKQKLEDGFRCIKIKVGAIKFEEELQLIKNIRKSFNSNELELRLDANGGFSVKNAMERLKILSDYDIHSLEQPIMAGQIEDMAEICNKSPIPIALDEELIRVTAQKDKNLLIKTIQPQYIILKPSLHGGISGCEEWIKIAENNNTGWWATSALESNIGLNAIAQWCGSKNPIICQGLGTGMLFKDNIEMGLEIRNAQLWKKDNFNYKSEAFKKLNNS